MEKHQKYYDRQTGKLAFNQPMAKYTRMLFIEKFLYWIYLYTVYPILGFFRILSVYSLTYIWIAIPLPFKDIIFTRLILGISGVIPTKPLQSTKLKQRKTAKYKLNKNTIIYANVTSPIDILLYIKHFKPNLVLFPSNQLVNPSVAFLKFLNFEQNYKLPMDKQIVIPAKKRVLVFPENVPTNQSVLLKNYLEDAKNIDNRPSIFAFCNKIWKYLPKQHPTFNIITLFDDLGSFINRTCVYITTINGITLEQQSQLSMYLAACMNVHIAEQDYKDRNNYKDEFGWEL